MAERDRWPLWIPVFLGGGIALYYGLPVEPPLWVGPMALAVCVAAGVAARRRLPWLALALCLGLAALGFAVAQMRTMRVAAPVLERNAGTVMVEGTIAQVELMPEGGQRAVLDDVAVTVDGATPTRIRLRFKPDVPPLVVGSRIRVRTVLIPPPPPVMPGAYDFPLRAWYMGLGAIGTALGQPETLTEPETRQGLRLILNHIRHTIAERIRAVLPGPEGGIAMAITTGETSGVPAAVLATYRDTGLAHILVIAGLHMGMVAGLVFFLVRVGLALIPPLALRIPTKKWAASAALLVCGTYDLLAGLPLPATRAFIMAALVLIGVLIDRGTLTIRLWALAAVVILLVEPEQVAGPSFQMSFAAVGTLIATYEIMGPVLANIRRRHRGRLAGAALWLGRMALTTMAAGTATTVYGLYHFNRIALYQLAANMMAVPVTGVAVMPFAVLSLALMPFGLEQYGLVPLGKGIAAIDGIAAWVAGWPSAQLSAPVLPTWGLLVFSAGGLWLCLWRGTWRWWGLALMVVGLSSMAWVRPPDILVDGSGKSYGLRMADGSLLISSRGRILNDTWGRRAGPRSEEWWPKRSHSNDGRVSCDETGCLYRTGRTVVALVRTEPGLSAACSGPDIVISAVPIHDPCKGARVVIDRFDLWRRGAHALWLENDGSVRMETTAGRQGDRPWALHPKPRKPRPKEEPRFWDDGVGAED
jgi:competence protein ComEC